MSGARPSTFMVKTAQPPVISWLGVAGAALGLVATFVSARRIARIDPAVILRA